MTKAVLIHNPSSIYDDEPETRYQFPKRYLKALEDAIGDWIIYYVPRSAQKSETLGYEATAKVQAIEVDPNDQTLYRALIEPRSYLEFECFVPYFDEARNQYHEQALRGENGSFRKGPSQSAVRPLSDPDFARILELGLPDEDTILPREKSDDRQSISGLAEDVSPFLMPRQVVETRLNRKKRDQAFRKRVIKAYDERCALTGLKFTNGGGRAEVQAAHIRPVQFDGADTVTNGIALSGTVHWMFDRGLVSLSDDYEILINRKVNDLESMDRILLPDRRARVPESPYLRPSPRYLKWHREHFEF